MERDGKVGVHLDGPGDGRVSRLEVIEGPSGRRRRTKAERARVAAEKAKRLPVEIFERRLAAAKETAEGLTIGL